jgi:hypothetical protein
MSQTAPEPGPEVRVRTMQMIVLAQAMGGLSFFVLALFFRSQGQFGPPPEVPVISYVIVAFAVAVSVASAVVPGVVLAVTRRKLAEERRGPESDLSPRWYGLCQTNLLLHIAPLEGAAFALLVAYLLEGRLWTALLALVFLAAIVAHFPTRSRVDAWVQRQRSLAEQGSP